MYLGQPNLIDNLVKKFGDHVKKLLSHKMSGMPKVLFVRLVIESNNISADNQWEYWLGIGISSFLVKHLD